jgi:hypothetical protein
VIQGSPFAWYVFAIPGFRRHERPHYLVCDWLQVRDWALTFGAPLGNDHRDHDGWYAIIHVYRDFAGETQAYFRWLDEPTNVRPREERLVRLDNVLTLREPGPVRVGQRGKGGESEAHRRLKRWIADNPTAVGLYSTARSNVEFSFRTGDRVDLMFENHSPRRTVVEVEVAAYETEYPAARTLADRYGVGLVSVPRERVFGLVA